MDGNNEETKVEAVQSELFPRGLYGSGVLNDDETKKLAQALKAGMVEVGRGRDCGSLIIGPDDLY